MRALLKENSGVVLAVCCGLTGLGSTAMLMLGNFGGIFIAFVAGLIVTIVTVEVLDWGKEETDSAAHKTVAGVKTTLGPEPDLPADPPSSGLTESAVPKEHYVYVIRLGDVGKIGVGRPQRIDKWRKRGWEIVATIRTDDINNSRHVEQAVLNQLRAAGATSTPAMLMAQSMKVDGYTEMYDVTVATVTATYGPNGAILDVVKNEPRQLPEGH